MLMKEMKSGLPVILILLWFICCKDAAAQLNSADSISYQSALANTRTIYDKQVGDQSPLYNGSQYVSYGFVFKAGSPYYMSDQFSNGSVVYDGILFSNLPLLYEDLREFLVTKKDGYLLQLINARISSFDISGHQFIRLIADSSNRGIPKTGFYEILYSGRSAVLKKTSKDIQEVASIYEGVLHFVEESDSYFIKRGNVFIRVKSGSELLDAFRDHQKDIQHFIKNNKLKFRKEKESTLIKAAGYYDQIVN
jgi:hypothetical protein